MFYLPEEDATVFAEMEGVSILLPLRVAFLQGEVHQLPVHSIALGQDQIPTELHEDGVKNTTISNFKTQSQNVIVKPSN